MSAEGSVSAEQAAPASRDTRPWTLRLRDPAIVSLLVSLLLVVGNWVRYPHGYTLSDPYAYARDAHSIAAGHLLEDAYQNPFWHRLGTTVPVAAVFAVFGVSPATVALVPLLAALVIVVAVWLALRDRSARMFGMLLAATSAPLLAATTDLYPDVVATAWFMPCLLLLERRVSLAEKNRGAIGGAFAAASWFAAFLAKETACWVLPLWAGILVVDLRRSRRTVVTRFHVPGILTGIVLGLAYLAFCRLVFGSAFSRITNINHLAALHNWTIHGRKALLSRLTYEPAVFFLEQYGPAWVLGVLGAAFARKELRFWSASGAFFVGAYWFGSAALTRYTPLPLITRMTLPCAPFFYILGGDLLGRLLGRLSRLPAMAGAALIVLLAYPAFRKYRASATSEPEAEALAIVRASVAAAPRSKAVLIASDPATAAFMDIYFGFAVPRNLQIRFVEDVNAHVLAGPSVVFLYSNAVRSRYVHRTYRRVVYDAALAKLPAQVQFTRSDVRLASSHNAKSIVAHWKAAMGRPLAK